MSLRSTFQGKARAVNGKGKSFIFNIEEINFTWKTAIAMQHSSGNRCFRGGQMHNENVIHRSDMSNT